MIVTANYLADKQGSCQTRITCINNRGEEHELAIVLSVSASESSVRYMKDTTEETGAGMVFRTVRQTHFMIFMIEDVIFMTSLISLHFHLYKNVQFVNGIICQHDVSAPGFSHICYIVCPTFSSRADRLLQLRQLLSKHFSLLRSRMFLCQAHIKLKFTFSVICSIITSGGGGKNYL